MSANIDVLTGKREGSNGTPQAHEDGRKRLRHTYVLFVWAGVSFSACSK